MSFTRHISNVAQTSHSLIARSMVNHVALLPLASLVLLQTEVNFFLDRLLNGVERQTILVIHTNDTSDLANSILRSSTMLQHNYRVENFEFPENSAYNWKHALSIAPEHMLIILIGNDDIVQINNWVHVYAGISPKTKRIFVFRKTVKSSQMEERVRQLADALHWYDSLMVQMNEKSTSISVYRWDISKNQAMMVDPRDAQFAARGQLFKAMFVKQHSDLKGRPFCVFGEADVPKVAFAKSKKDQLGVQRYVVGSEVSVAIMLGRYLNVSVHWLTGYYNPATYNRIASEQQKKAFKEFLEPSLVVDIKRDEVLPWKFNGVDFE